MFPFDDVTQPLPIALDDKVTEVLFYYHMWSVSEIIWWISVYTQSLQWAVMI